MASHLTSSQVYSLLKTIPKGKVTTYKSIAQACSSRGYRAVGQILKNNLQAPRVPCHRVVGSNGKIGGYKGSTTRADVSQKIRLLKKEGVVIRNGTIINFKTLFFSV